ncbi:MULTISPECIES: GNAT family N-acetyltransferase [Prochlorococcus]|uniref:Acetyltransferase n=1 Tax=Prochlorococcus marinus (strain SARG / CCMP1375 / SS120) TaxID=167539 RepID=Q7VC65_PROMA|nr:MULTISPECIES: GNAT family N-acetyltransferase [Prochlorococcus]AAP99921.1 Acetyltransferase [Prochlorococcus marinus subsp. marinus str. CCMP1375]KGG11731.1 GCN5-related N-acetyltransferase [Prochlorococcus marinus str. LG]KGG18855.1 GCN5-related N-acetyltransferase [Prochlorococcus marinus str. SS2]KGG23607.1 GCN5-related N-acetyltransferase [Prochlorococcus marinus str. SS35]KGG32157.1 GCN5-related N-acetyltransferase [Prochlorococcus marinus str. SS51]
MKNKDFNIRKLLVDDIDTVTNWARNEGFAPGLGDVDIYRNTDNQGLWIGSINDKPIGCIAGIKYNQLYGFLGLFIIDKIYRGNGYGVQLWRHVLNKLDTIDCIGIEAALDRINDYEKWGFKSSSITTRWQISCFNQSLNITNYDFYSKKYILLEGSEIPQDMIQEYDKNKEYTPRPHFLSDWLSHQSGTVLALVNKKGLCVGFSRIRPCLLRNGSGYRIGPLIADTPDLASYLLSNLTSHYSGVILIDSPGRNTESNKLFRSLNFEPISHTVRMYRGNQPSISMREIYGLACLELG